MNICCVENCDGKIHGNGLCSKHYKLEWRKTSEAYKKSSKEYAKNYVVNAENKAKSDKNYYEKNKKKIINRQIVRDKKRYLDDVDYRLKIILRARLRSALKNNSKTGSSVKDLGCSIEEFKEYLESKFTPDMNWDNYGFHGWHIDHIRPLASFDLTDRQQLLLACHYTNLQPLWCTDNWKKSDLEES